jgi:hypothetical protein
MRTLISRSILVNSRGILLILLINLRPDIYLYIKVFDLKYLNRCFWLIRVLLVISNCRSCIKAYFVSFSKICHQFVHLLSLMTSVIYKFIVILWSLRR